YRLEIARTVAPNACWLGLHSLCVVIIGLMAIGGSDYALLACVYGIVACAFVCDLSSQRTVVSLTPISSLGYLTYSVYMLHTVVATVLLAVLLPMFLGTSQEMMLVAVGTATLATLALAVL